jgi:riboflavin synthase
MFTGLVEAKATLLTIDRSQDSAVLTFSSPDNFGNLNLGESINVNGACLTVTNFNQNAKQFSVDAMGITLDITNLGDLSIGASVNLERAMKLGDRFGGHIVQGHIDGVSKLIERTPQDNWEIFRFTLPDLLSSYMVKKGSICLNGVSLTISDIANDWFEVSIIPTTLAMTNLAELAQGSAVNLEVDLIAKYVESLLTNRKI